MAKGRKKKGRARAGAAEPSDPHIRALRRVEAQGDNRRARVLADRALEDVEASPDAKSAALATKQRLAFDPVALAFGAAGAAIWVTTFLVFIALR